jgi:hypothetical protein
MRVRSRGPLSSHFGGATAGQAADGLHRTDSEPKAHPGDRAGQSAGGMDGGGDLVKARRSSRRRSRRNGSAAMPGRTGGRGGVGRCGDASGREVGSDQNPGGKPSPRKERAVIDWQRSEVATDLPAEQRLEVEGRRARHCFRTAGGTEVQRRGGKGRRRRRTKAAELRHRGELQVGGLLRGV